VSARALGIAPLVDPLAVDQRTHVRAGPLVW
jgi:hypothetical protein